MNSNKLKYFFYSCQMLLSCDFIYFFLRLELWIYNSTDPHMIYDLRIALGIADTSPPLYPQKNCCFFGGGQLNNYSYSVT